jgi:hypothetical protein
LNGPDSILVRKVLIVGRLIFEDDDEYHDEILGFGPRRFPFPALAAVSAFSAFPGESSMTVNPG